MSDRLISKTSINRKLEIFKNGGQIPMYKGSGILKRLWYWRSPTYNGTFSQAYAQARQNGDKDFWWNGNIYNTKVKPTEPTKPQKATSKSPYVPSKAIKDYIKKVESFKSEWYKDGNGHSTIGYGFKESAHPQLRQKYKSGMTQAEANKYFETVIANSLARFEELTPNFDKLNQNQRDALLSYYYNIGQGSYSTKSPSMQKALREQNWEEVARQMDFGYNDPKNPGLKDRRDYERKLFLTPV